MDSSVCVWTAPPGNATALTFSNWFVCSLFPVNLKGGSCWDRNSVARDSKFKEENSAHVDVAGWGCRSRQLFVFSGRTTRFRVQGCSFPLSTINSANAPISVHASTSLAWKLFYAVASVKDYCDDLFLCFSSSTTQQTTSVSIPLLLLIFTPQTIVPANTTETEPLGMLQHMPATDALERSFSSQKQHRLDGGNKSRDESIDDVPDSTRYLEHLSIHDTSPDHGLVRSLSISHDLCSLILKDNFYYTTISSTILPTTIEPLNNKVPTTIDVTPMCKAKRPSSSGSLTRLKRTPSAASA